MKAPDHITGTATLGSCPNCGNPITLTYRAALSIESQPALMAGGRVKVDAKADIDGANVSHQCGRYVEPAPEAAVEGRS